MSETNINDDFCNSCPSLKFLPGPNIDDWLDDSTRRAVCIRMDACIDWHKKNRPIWCPRIKNELTEKEKIEYETNLDFHRRKYFNSF